MRVRATAAGICNLGDGVRVVVREGAEYDSNDEVVREFGWMFERVGGAVEQATAAPGERRNVKR